MPVDLYLRKDRHIKSAGFTLAEMMVVITISALLSALLLPALSTAKEKSRRAVCKSNIREMLMVLENYADDNAEVLPSSADNSGEYHSIILSDETFSNLVLIAGNSNIFYCPNIVFGDNPGSVAQHNPKYGYVIGYSYWAGLTIGSRKGPEYLVLPSKATDLSLATNALVSDANYWTGSQGSSAYFPADMTVSPHSPVGAAMAKGSTFTVGLAPGPTNSAGLGAQGGNAGFFPDTSVLWRTINPGYLNSVETIPASSTGDDHGNR
jgi:prepilin-type N-terminal cleavage/methylation domain-containing protein